jgi:hypothetical protein
MNQFSQITKFIRLNYVSEYSIVGFGTKPRFIKLLKPLMAVLLCFGFGGLTQAQSVNEILTGKWVVKDSYCANFLENDESLCSDDPYASYGNTYEFIFDKADGKIKRGDYWYPCWLQQNNGRLMLTIDMKMMKDTWYIVDIDINTVRLVFFQQSAKIGEGMTLNGDFTYQTWTKQY